jgi:protein-S-isoprenylcysteine O-methyltransferase Ste14
MNSETSELILPVPSSLVSGKQKISNRETKQKERKKTIDNKSMIQNEAKKKKEIPTILLFSLVFSFSFFSCCSNSAKSLLTFSARVSFFFFFSGGGEALELKEKVNDLASLSILKKEKVTE